MMLSPPIHPAVPPAPPLPSLYSSPYPGSLTLAVPRKMAELPTTTKQGANYRPMVKFGFLHVLEYRPSCRQKSHASRTTPRARIISQTFIAGEGKFGRCRRFFLLSPSIIRAARTGSLANNRRVLRRVVLVTCCLVLLIIPCKDTVLLSLPPLKVLVSFPAPLSSFTVVF